MVATVEEGRAIFVNIRKFLRFLLSSNIGEVMTMFLGVTLASVIGLSSEAGAAWCIRCRLRRFFGLIWSRMARLALALAVDPPDARTMSQPPRPHAEHVITRRTWTGIVSVGLVMATGTLLVRDAALPQA
jgi:P-type Ca2+ transporter type 2C